MATKKTARRSPDEMTPAELAEVEPGETVPYSDPPSQPKRTRLVLNQAGRDARDATLELQRIEAKRKKLAEIAAKRTELDAETARLLGEIKRHEAMLSVLTAHQPMPEA